MVLPEGNTRTIITFCCQFIESQGWYIDSDLFRQNAQYMRTALVAATAVFHDLGDKRNTGYIDKIVMDALMRGQQMKNNVISEIQKANMEVTNQLIKKVIDWNRREGREHNYEEITICCISVIN